jgi:hypothetical protein
VSPVEKRERRKPKPPPTDKPAPKPITPTPKPGPIAKIGSYGNASIDQWDEAFVHATDEVARKKGVRVNPRIIKAMMDVETGGNGNYPADRCRGSDGYDNVPACGPMQIKYPYHRQRCMECDFTTVPGQIELATHIIGDKMKELNTDEYHALVAPGGYFPGDDVNGTTQGSYVARVRKLVAAMERSAVATPTPPKPTPSPEPAKDPWRPYPYPPMVDLLVAKPAEGAGFTRCAFRRPLIQGFTTHITDGPPSQSIEFFAEFFGTGGARAWDALTDLVIGFDGRIGLLNDWRDPNRGGTRAGWANGWGNEGPGFENGGQEFYRKYPDINVVLVSCEHCQKAGGVWSDAMIDASIEIRTAIAQELKIPAASYPINPRTGLSVEQEHRNFAQKSCPADPYISVHRHVIIPEVKVKLAAWQGGEVDIPAPEPAKTYTDWGLSLEQVAHEFGILTRYNADGTVDELPFDPGPTGAVSLAWLNRCEKEGIFPEAEELRLWDSEVRPGEEWWASFEGGWRLIRSAGDNRDVWKWLDEMGEPE